MREMLWEYRNKDISSEEITRFAKSCGIRPLMALLLMNRGLRSQQEVSGYFKKGLDGIHNPMLLNDMDKATERILKALSDGEKITVYGDYDVDGTTASAIVYGFLKEQGAAVECYIPDRHKEGYGINIMALNRIAKSGTKLIITVDCGITACGETEFAKTQGIDMVITDHHTCREELPKAVAVVNQKRPDSTYPFSELCGAGVAFKLVLALAMAMKLDTKEIFYKYADLAALGTIADVVSLTDENRIIANRGIAIMESRKNPGISALLDVAGLKDKSIDSTAVAFALAPRLNAAGRMETASLAFSLLTETNPEKALESAIYLGELNKNRQDIERSIFEEALEQAYSFENEQYVYVLSGEGWHEGVIGIVASKICERFYRPCILISCTGGKGKGSGRSIDEMNLFDALSDSEQILSGFGGHSQAAGLSLGADKIEEFRISINKYAKEILKDKQLVPKIRIDCPLKPSSVTMQTAKMLEDMNPFGTGNELPIFSASGMKVLSSDLMGAGGKHLRLKLLYGENTYIAAGFNMGEWHEILHAGDLINVAFSMNINVYQGMENLQLIIKDIKK